MSEEKQEANKARPRRLGDILTRRDRFIYTVELVPGRGSRGKRQDEVLRLAKDAARGGLIDALSITDNPGGHPALAPDVMGAEVCRLGIDPIIHFTCKDKNRNQIESILYALDRLGIRNVLAMTGDYPLYGFQGKAKPVYDIDSVQLLHLIGRMNRGLAIDDRAPGGGAPAPPIHMVKGCAVSPFKQLESETMAQYFKLWKKVRAGADFVVTQVGFDARKFDELLVTIHAYGIDVPILGNVYVLTLPVARAMNRNSVPGCVVTNKLLSAVEEESHAKDQGRSASLERAARLVAVLRGMGYDGAHIGGPGLAYGEIEQIIGRSKEFKEEWRSLVPEFDFPQDGGFYIYEKDPTTGLNRKTPRQLPARPRATVGYTVMRALHRTAFAEGAPLYRILCSFFRLVDRTPLEEAVTEVEYWLKFITSRCRRCGDCTLAEVAFLCPQSQCPKFLFNGQCGGSLEGWCEVFPGKRKCIFVRAYGRLASRGEEVSLKGNYIRPRDWALDQTSSWVNYFLGRDHRGQTCERAT